MHIHKIVTKRGGKVYESILLRESYYDKGKRKKRTLAVLTHLPKYLVEQIEMVIVNKGEALFKVKDINFIDGYNIGDIGSLFEIICDIGLDKTIYSKGIKERELVLMMIIGRILHPSSKLENTRWIKRREEGFRRYFKIDYDKLRVDELYSALDWIEKRQKKIEDRLYEIRKNPTLFLYDITSSYFEGKKGELSEYGYNRDKKRGKKQIVIGLMVDKEGYPINIEVFKGNTADRKTVKGKIEKIKEEYGVEKAVFIGDRGMITEARMRDLEGEGFGFITCLTHKKVEELIKSEVKRTLFDEKLPVEIEYNGKRCILCKSEERERDERIELASLLRMTKKRLDKIKGMVKSGKLKDGVKIGERVGRWKDRYKVGKYFVVEIKDGKFNYRLDKEALKINKSLLGCYAVVTNLKKEEYKTEEVINHYKSLTLVERAFRMIKTELLNIRPIHHYKERRIKAHVFICMLAYYLVVEMKKRLKGLFEENGKGRDYDLTFEGILEELKEIKMGRLKVKEMTIEKLKPLTPLQKRLLKELRIDDELKGRQ